MRVKRRHSRSRPSLFLSLSLPLLSCASRFAPSITYSLSLPPALIAPRLISSPASPTVSITSRATGDGSKKKEEATERFPSLVQLPEKRVQLNDESTRKQKQLESPAASGDVRLPCCRPIGIHHADRFLESNTSGRRRREIPLAAFLHAFHNGMGQTRRLRWR